MIKLQFVGSESLIKKIKLVSSATIGEILIALKLSGFHKYIQHMKTNVKAKSGYATLHLQFLCNHSSLL